MTIDDLLGEHTPHVARLARWVIDHIGEAADWTELRVYEGWHGVGFHHAEAGYVVGVFPRADSVRVVLERGDLLGEAPYLEGTGQTHQLELTGWDEDRIAVVDDLIDRALDH